MSPGRGHLWGKKWRKWRKIQILQWGIFSVKWLQKELKIVPKSEKYHSWCWNYRVGLQRGSSGKQTMTNGSDPGSIGSFLRVLSCVNDRSFHLTIASSTSPNGIISWFHRQNSKGHFDLVLWPTGYSLCNIDTTTRTLLCVADTHIYSEKLHNAALS